MPRLPPHEKNSRYLSLRVSVDTHPDRIDAVIAFLQYYWTDFLVAHEIGKKTERPHIHCYVRHQGSPKLVFSSLFKMHVARKLGLQSSEWSVVNIEPTTASERTSFCYHCKGEKSGEFPDIRFMGLYSANDILQAQTEYWAKHITTYFPTVVPDTPEGHQQIIKTVKTRTKTWTEKVCELLDDENFNETIGLKGQWDYNNDKHIQLMTNIVLDRLGDRGMKFDQRLLNQHVLGFLNHVGAKGLRQDFVNSTLSAIRFR